MTQQTLGQYRVGLSFNPSGDPMVDQIKTAAAALIDMIEQIPAQSGEVGRLKSLAQTHIEDAAMWGVKAATKQAPPEGLFAETRPSPQATPSVDPFRQAVRESVQACMGSTDSKLWLGPMQDADFLHILHAMQKRGFKGISREDLENELRMINGGAA